MTTTQRVDVERLSELLAKATPGPWEVDPYGDVTANSEDVARIATGDDRAAYDAALIAAMHEALPALLLQLAERDAEIALLNRDVAEAREVFRQEYARAEAAERAREEAKQVALEVAQDIATCIPFLPPVGQKNIRKCVDRLIG